MSENAWNFLTAACCNAVIVFVLAVEHRRSEAASIRIKYPERVPVRCFIIVYSIHRWHCLPKNYWKQIRVYVGLGLDFWYATENYWKRLVLPIYTTNTYVCSCISSSCHFLCLCHHVVVPLHCVLVLSVSFCPWLHVHMYICMHFVLLFYCYMWYPFMDFPNC